MKFVGNLAYFGLAFMLGIAMRWQGVLDLFLCGVCGVCVCVRVYMWVLVFVCVCVFVWVPGSNFHLQKL